MSGDIDAVVMEHEVLSEEPEVCEVVDILCRSDSNMVDILMATSYGQVVC